MLNLLRMDLYRMLRSKSVYICLAILLMMVMVSLGMVSLVATPQGQEMARGAYLLRRIWRRQKTSCREWIPC